MYYENCVGTLLYFAWADQMYNSSITTILCQGGSYRTVVG